MKKDPATLRRSGWPRSQHLMPKICFLEVQDIMSGDSLSIFKDFWLGERSHHVMDFFLLIARP